MSKTVSNYTDPTRTHATEAIYLAGGQMLVRRASKLAPNATDVVDALIVLFSDLSLVLKASTTRTYKAQIGAVLKHLVAVGVISNRRATFGCAAIADLLLQRRGRPPKRTSAKKNKKPAFEEYMTLVEDIRRRSPRSLDLTDRVLARMLGVSPYVGLRPVEWLAATLDGRSLIVVNAKSTNGRAPGPFRTIDMSEIPREVLRATERLIDDLQNLSPIGSNWRTTLKVLDERLARDCARLKISRWSISIFRHIAQANWKKAGFSKAEIAALAGHISTQTSRNHYAGGRYGWIPEFAVVRPDPALVEEISLHNQLVVSTNGTQAVQLPPNVDSTKTDGVATGLGTGP